jgi:hypothetical protein
MIPNRSKAASRRADTKLHRLCNSTIHQRDPPENLSTLAERLLGRIAKQRGTGRVPANDRSRVVGTDDSVSVTAKPASLPISVMISTITPWIWSTWCRRGEGQAGRGSSRLSGPAATDRGGPNSKLRGTLQSSLILKICHRNGKIKVVN